MGLPRGSNVVGGFSREKRASPGERVMSSLFPYRTTGFPGVWGQEHYEQILHFQNWTFVAVDALASLIGQLLPNMAFVRNRPRSEELREKDYQDWRYRELGVTPPKSKGLSGGLPQLWSVPGGLATSRFSIPGGYYAKALSVVKPHEDLEPLGSDHPLRRLLEDPNPVDTSFDLLYELDMFLELCGTAYIWTVPNRWGVPCELWVLPTHWMWPRTGGKGKDQYLDPEHPNADRLIEYYECRPYGAVGSAQTLYFPAEEVVRIHWKSPINKLDGYSKLYAARHWIDTEESIGRSRWAQMMNIARPEMLIQLGEGYEDPDDDRIARIEAKIATKLQGEYNYGKPFIVPPGTKVTPLSFNPTEMAYTQSEDQIRDMILSTFRVPGSAVGLSKDMTFGSILATLAQMCSFAVNPRLVMLGLQLTKHLAPKFERRGDPGRIRIWWDDSTPPNPEQVNADIAADAAQLAICPNEVRAFRGRKPWKHGGNDPIFNGAPVPLETGKDLSEMGKLVPILGEREPPPQQQQPGGAVDNGAPPDMSALPPDLLGEGQTPEELPEQMGLPGIDGNDLTAEDLNAGIDEPNGPPQKRLPFPSGHKNGKAKENKPAPSKPSKKLLELAAAYLKGRGQRNGVAH